MFSSLPGLLLPQQIPYAETHYKFKLPWSPIFKHWPEVFIDGPRFSLPGQNPIFYLVIKDADYYPITITGAQAVLQGQGQLQKHQLTFPRNITGHFHFLPFTLPGLQSTVGDFVINVKICLKKASGSERIILNSNLTGIMPIPLSHTCLGTPLPYPAGWFSGELHCHSTYSSDPVEFGMSPAGYQQAARALGLSFVVCTDHSYDFYYQKERYMQPGDPTAKWRQYCQEVNDLNNNVQGPLMVAGEEVSCANSLGRNVHMLVLGHKDFIPGLGDGGRRWFNNKPDLTIQQVLEIAQGTPCFAAHPRARIGSIEQLAFRRGAWGPQDLNDSHLAVNGLQFWNGARDRGFSLGRAFWVQQLLKGRKLTAIGANDAHGDLNKSCGISVPLFKLYQNTNHIFGNVRTLVKADTLNVNSLHQSLNSGAPVSTEGAFLNLEPAQGKVCVVAKSIDYFGLIKKIHLFSGNTGDTSEKVVSSWILEKDTGDFEERIPIPSGITYLRAEAYTSKGRLAMTSPLFV